MKPLSSFKSNIWSAYTLHSLVERSKWCGFQLSRRCLIEKFNSQTKSISVIFFSGGISLNLYCCRFIWWLYITTLLGSVLKSTTDSWYFPFWSYLLTPNLISGLTEKCLSTINYTIPLVFLSFLLLKGQERAWFAFMGSLS